MAGDEAIHSAIADEVAEVLQAAVATNHFNAVETTLASYAIGFYVGLLLAKSNPIEAQIVLDELQGNVQEGGRQEAADAVKRYVSAVRPSGRAN
jgi:hypothetical protein